MLQLLQYLDQHRGLRTKVKVQESRLLTIPPDEMTKASRLKRGLKASAIQ